MTGMKTLSRLLLAGAVILLLGISLVSAHGGDEPDTTHMGDNRMMDGAQMSDMSDHMVINGTIDLEDSIILTLNVGPSDEMIQEMDDHMDEHMGPNNHMNDFQTGDYVNEMSVSLYSLVEFEDDNSDGYSSDDIVLSSYLLNSENLNDPVLIVESYYEITSKDNLTFRMVIDMRIDDNLFSGYKWSLDIHYPWNSNTSQLALMHQINSNGDPMMEQQRMQYGMENGTHMQFQENHMDDNHNTLPMFFNWADTVDVDGSSKAVVATAEEEIFALTVPQGLNIFYDPEIGIDSSAIRAADSSLDGVFDTLQNFMDTVDSPTVAGLVLGGFLLIMSYSFVIIRKRTN